MTDDVTISILGSCASRNIFNIDEGIKYKIVSYVQRQNPLLLEQKGYSLKVSDEEIEDFLTKCHKSIRKGLEHNFPRRSFKTLLNNNGKEMLLREKSQWLIIDTWYIQNHFLLIAKDKTQKQSLFFSGGYARYALDYFKRNLSDRYDVDYCEASINISYYMSDLCQFIEKHWGSNVILFNSKPAPFAVDGAFSPKSDYYSSLVKSDQFSLLFLKKIKSHYLETPPVCVRIDENPVHYHSLINKYLKHKIDSIVSNTNAMFDDYSDIKFESKLDYFLFNNHSHLQIETDSDYGDDNLSHYRDYRYGLNGHSEDLNNALSYLKKAVDNEESGFEMELFDFITVNKLTRHYDYMLECLIRASGMKNASASFLLGKIYYFGLCGEINKDVAKQYLQKSSSQDNNNAKLLLFDLLWASESVKDKEELYKLTCDEVSNDNYEFIARLGKMYHSGIYVKQDYSKARYYYQIALNNGVRWVSDCLRMLPDTN